MSRKLHIGGESVSPGWEILNINPGPHVNHVCDATDLSIFDDCSFAEVYASHILEHLDYNDELAGALAEWYRVLIPAGRLYISVPDLDVLARLFLLKDDFTVNERFDIMRMIFGGHVDEYDYHVVGLNEEFLGSYLATTGFTNIQKVERFNLFDDTSNMVVNDVLISLNMTAEKPGV